MDAIDQAKFEFDPKFGIVIGFMVAIMVFGVALDLRWEQFRRILRDPRAPVVGLLAQFVILPGIAWLIARYLVDTPSVALGLLLVASVPGGSVSNYMTHLAKGDVATSVTITAVTTVGSILATPVLFAFLASSNPTTAALLRDVGINPGELAAMFAITIGIPIAAGMLIGGKRPELAARMKPWVSRISMTLFALIVVTGTLMNVRLMLDFARQALAPTAIACAAALMVGWTLSWLARLKAADRRAVTIEAGGQQAGLAIAMALAFFPSLAGVAVMGAVWGAVQVLFIVPLVGVWSRLPPPARA